MSTDFVEKKGILPQRAQIIARFAASAFLLALLESAKPSIFSVWLINHFYIGKESATVALSVISPYTILARRSTRLKC